MQDANVFCVDGLSIVRINVGGVGVGWVSVGGFGV